MKASFKKIKHSFLRQSGFYFALGSLLTLGVFVFSLVSFAAWSNPTANPPSNNVPDMINSGAVYQTKLGTLKLGTTTPTNIANLFVYNGQVAIATSTLKASLTVGYPGGIGNAIDVDGNRIVGLSTIPLSDNEAASRFYVDSSIATVNFWADRGSNGNISNTNAGNVGIGTGSVAPNNLFQVRDLIDFNNTDSNTKIGYQAGKNIVAGAHCNTFLGYGAGLSAGAGGTNAAIDNVAIGFASFGVNTTGNEDVAIGARALSSNSSGSSNSAVGWHSLNANTTGSWNTAMGESALRDNTTSTGNSAFGAWTLMVNTTGRQNSAFGSHAMYSSLTGNYNTVGGYEAFYGNTSGNGNVVMGFQAARYQADGATGLTTATSSVYVGYQARGFNNSDDNSIVIGAKAVGIGANTVVLGNDSIAKTALKGSVGIGTTNPSYVLEVVGNNGAGDVMKVRGTGVSSDIAFYNTSDVWGGAIGNDNVPGTFDVGSGFQDLRFMTGSSASNWGTERMRIQQTTGNVGIGTPNPSVKLEVVGDIKVSGTITAGPGDLAEEFFTDKNYPAGTVLVMADSGYKSARACSREYDSTVIGVISEDPGLVIGKIEGKYKAQIALTGVVKVRVNNSSGKIAKGDLLTTPAVKGEAMKAAKPEIGTIIGKALESDTGKGFVMALVNLK
jgi:hypothetical protein